MDQDDAPRPASAPPDEDQPETVRAPDQQGRSEPVFNMPGIVLAVIAICVAVHLVRTQFLNIEQDFDVILHGAFIPVFYTGAFGFDPWLLTAPVSYSLLHGDVLHLGVNLVWLAAFGSPLAGRMGNLRFALFWVVTAAAAAFLFLLLHPFGDAPLVGASGAISGMMGAAARFGFRIDRRDRPPRFAGPPMSVAEALSHRTVFVFLAAWFAVNLATGLLGAVPGFEGQIAWEAHVGGFLAGFFGLPAMLGRARLNA
ncbi:MAG TPA: rhomboid family intramembrane serine protease [Mesorhizobium sp.]|jgi:membrane associated rhomboid family serine protease|nr:rhomboid family intramembrane serine protease [Mesorhizobium sp.]